MNFSNQEWWYTSLGPVQGKHRSIQAQGQPRLIQISRPTYVIERNQISLPHNKFLMMVLETYIEETGMKMICKHKNVCENFIINFK